MLGRHALNFMPSDTHLFILQMMGTFMEWGPQRYVHFLISELVCVTLFEKWVFVDVIKDLKMKSSWVTQMDPKISNRCLCKG